MTALEHSLLLFTVAGVTLLSFLTGILVLPKLATGPAHTTNHYSRLPFSMMWSMSWKKDLKQSTNQGAVYATIDNYNQRLEDLILEQESNDVKEELANIRVMIMEIERRVWNMPTRRVRFQNSNTISTNVISRAWNVVSTVVLSLAFLTP